MAKRKVKENGKFGSAEEVLDLHTFSSSLYTAANQRATEVEELVFQNWDTPKDAADSEYQPHRPSKPRAIMDNFRRSLSAGIGSDLERKVLPLKMGDTEQAKCTQIEFWLDGADRKQAWETNRDYKRDFIFWYTLRGRSYLQQVFNPDADSDCLPIRVYADDPLTTFPVHGRDGILWYTQECEYYVRQLKQELAYKGRVSEELEKMDDNDCVTVVKYWDDTYHAAVFGKDFLLNVKHDYGFVNLAEAHCNDTPLADAEYAFTAVIAPVLDELKMQAELAEKMRTGMEYFFFPHLFGVSATGTPIVMSAKPNVGITEALSPGADLKQVSVNVNHQIFQQLMSYAQSGINLSTMPESTFGVEPKNLESGFAIAQVLNQSRMAIVDKLPNLERALGRSYSNILRLVKQFGKRDLNWSVPADFDE